MKRGGTVYIMTNKYHTVFYTGVTSNSIRNMAVANRILVQAEEEGKEYINRLLHELGRADIIVRFADEAVEVNPAKINLSASSFSNSRTLTAIPFGFVPVW